MKHSVHATLTVLWLVAVSGAQAQQYEAFDTTNLNLANRLCATCHGPDGQGNPVVGGPRLADIEPWYLRNQLVAFRSNYRGTQSDYIPAHEMRASVAELSDAEIDNLVAQVGQWVAPENEPSVSGDSAHGAELYVSCGACHGLNGEGNEALAAPGLAAKDDWYLFRQIKLFQSGYRGAHPEDVRGRQMRPYVDVFASDQDINDLLAYLNTLGT